MAVPATGPLSMKDMAQEALHGTWGTGTIINPISLYDLVNGGQLKGSGDNYPTVNENCLPNPATRGSSVSYVEIKQVYKRVNTQVTGPFTHYISPSQASNAASMTSSTIIYSNSALTTPVGEFGSSSSLVYWEQDATGLSNAECVCGYNYSGNWDTNSNSQFVQGDCGQ